MSGKDGYSDVIRSRAVGSRGVLLTLTTTARPASDLGYLLHKHPERAQSFSATGGRAHVFYPAADDDLCTAALLLDLLIILTIFPLPSTAGAAPTGNTQR